MTGDSFALACWNTEWHGPRTAKGAALKRALLVHAPDIVCLPEAHHDFLADEYFGIASDPDHGYPIRSGRSKVTLWSRWPWFDVDHIGVSSLPPGRFVAGTTQTPVGPVRVIGLCIPWRAAHVSSGRRDSAPWAEHERFLDALPKVLARQLGSPPLLVMGDFNQRRPARLVPESLAAKLAHALTGLTVWTEGIFDGIETELLCHIAGAGRLAEPPKGISRVVGDLKVSDHDGVVLRVHEMS